ncbi:hypothetical protein BT69DRAFT_1283787, partial [Atractiella rhizophila]
MPWDVIQDGAFTREFWKVGRRWIFLVYVDPTAGLSVFDRSRVQHPEQGIYRLG